jgi:putative transcriptional regulator
LSDAYIDDLSIVLTPRAYGAAFAYHVPKCRPREVMRNNIRELRLGRGWTVTELAQKVGVSRQAILSVERGKLVKLDIAFRLALHPRIEDLFLPDETVAKQTAPRKQRAART